MLLPVLLMVIFVELFGGAIHTGGKYVTYVVPGVLILCTGFGSALTAVSVCQDASGGIVDRFRAMDIRGAALLSGHVVASIARNAASTALVIAVALALGFRPDADLLRLDCGVGFLLAFVAARLLALRSDRPARKVTRSCQRRRPSYHVPPLREQRLRPRPDPADWLQGFANTNRSLRSPRPSAACCSEHAIGSNAWIALAWCAGILALSVVDSRALFARRGT